MSTNTCKIEGCSNEVVAKGLCTTHYLRQRRHGSTDRPKHLREKLLEQGLSYCPKCNQTKSKNDFNEDKHTAFGIAIYCKTCNSEKGKIRYKDHKDKHINHRLKKKFGLTLEEYNGKFESQDRKCAICKKENKTDKMFPVDHCHETDKVRGILCDQCNQGLGLFYDNIEFLKSAIEYLKSHESQDKTTLNAES